MAGLAQYSPFFANPVFTRTIQEIPVSNRFIAGRFLPRQETFETKFYESVVIRQADMAPMVSGLAEVPLTDRDPMRKVSGEIADIAQGYLVTKEELGALMDKGNEARRKIAETQLLNKARSIRENVDARIEWMGWQALGNGQLVYQQNGVYLTADFGLDPSKSQKTAATKWNAVDPDILDNYEAWVQAYIDNNGVAPSVFVTSTAVVSVMLNDATLRKQITGNDFSLITLDQLNTFLRGRQMPPIEAFDGQVTYRDLNNGTRTTARLLDSKKGVFLRDGGEVGVQLLGPTIENNMNPGIYAETIDLKMPTRSVINVVASSFPKIQNPDLIMQATVLA